MSETQLLTGAEVAELLRVHESTVLRWARDGLIPVVRLPGGGRRFRRSDVESVLEPDRAAS